MIMLKSMISMESIIYTVEGRKQIMIRESGREVVTKYNIR